MNNTPRILALLALLAPVACDVDDETANRVGEGVVGVGLDSTDLQDYDLDELTDAADPSFACSDAGWDPAWAALEDQVLTLVNQKRAAGAVCGGVSKPPVPPVTAQAQLRCAARNHSKDMGVNNFFSHTGSNGSTFTQRITAAGYVWKAAGENIAAGYSTAAQVVNGWMASTGHCNNIMNGNYKHLGIGYYYGGSSTYKHYWTQDFGKN
ncbi:Cysteine-rich secretory protein family protein [Nannocystis exedens]|uniref:Cysteine-rich secretory protein family protein n=1 Tax=Nannocystis exedens TaxID=54 RepID=A0A1I2CV79_9BACT|nr:CAP domain-containing protein [Nannocystis exedens]PCC68550.1 membrane protein [Nannocystis exedens]SFE71703.1 Cysteine-rich secretory protein family protein [Nannocystis exedens]